MASSDTRVSSGIRVRLAQPEDAMRLAPIAYDSFLAFNKSVNLPPHLDYTNFEQCCEVMKYLTSTPKVHGFVAVEESSGAIMAGGFIHSGEVHGVGPKFADNAFKGRGAAKAVMGSIIEKAESENAKSIRLCQITANVVSFSLYASLGSSLQAVRIAKRI